jgi:hypothetical protein
MASSDPLVTIGAVVRLLASEAASFVTGTAVDVDGGWLSYGGVGDTLDPRGEPRPATSTQNEIA